MTAPHLEPGHVVAGKYTLRSLLGYSPVVATYHAVSSQGHEVALKLYDPAIGQRADVMSALERVAAESAALPGDAVLRVYDSGYDLSTSAPFSVTEMLTIPSLAKLAESGPLSEEVVATIIAGLGAALDPALARGLFHHALKPTNIFVGPAPDYAVRVTDFGSAVVRSAVPTHEAYHQSAPWWAPEQVQPGSQLSAPTDVFAAALVAFYLLTGYSYWRSCQSTPPDIQAWQQELMAARVSVSTRAQELGRGLNVAVDGLFARALASDPAERPQSVSEFAAALAAPGAPAEQSPQTMALPQFEDYSAAPAAAPAAAPGMEAQQQPVAAAPGMEAQQPAVAAEAMAAGPTPGLPPFPQPAAKKSKSVMVPVLIAVAVAVLFGGGAVTYLFFLSNGDETTASAKADSDDDDDNSDGDDDDSTSSVAGGDDGDAGTGDTDPAEQKVAVTIVCKPSCEEIKVDDEKVKPEDLDKPLELLPGKHTLLLSKKGYVPLKKTITVELGEPIKNEYTLRPIATGKPQKHCGKFVKKGCK